MGVVGVAVDSEEADVVAEVTVVRVVDADDPLDEEDEEDVAAAVLSSPVDEGAGPFPSTLFGHR